MIRYKKNQVITVPVVDIRKEGNRSYFVCGLEDGQTCEVGIFPFQKKEEIPSEIELFIKDVRDGLPVVSQNTASLFRRFHEVGGCYLFQVEEFIQTFPRPYYRVIDSNGLAVKLSNYGEAELKRMQYVTCRVLEITDSAIEMELVGSEEEKPLIGFRPLSCNGKEKGWLELVNDILPGDERLSDLHRCFIRWALLRAGDGKAEILPSLEKYRAGNGEWIIGLVSDLDRHLEDWIPRLLQWHRESSRLDRNDFFISLLRCYRKICVFLLEDTDTVSFIDDTEAREKYQDMLICAERHARDYEEAVRMLVEEKDGAALAFAGSVLRKIETSGFLLMPEERLRTLLSLFRLCPELMDTFFPRFMDSVISSHSRWEKGPFHSQIFGLLECYIGYCAHIVDTEGPDYGDNAGNRLHLLLRALALELLLAGAEDGIDRSYYRAQLYRFASYVENARTEVLIEKSFNCLVRDSYPPLEFGWTIAAMLNPGALAGLLSIPVETAAEGCRVYHGRMAELRIAEGMMCLSTYESSLRQRRQLPSDIMPWHGIQVLAGGRPDPGVKPSKEDDLVRCQSWWSYLDRCIFVFNADTPSPRKEDGGETPPEEEGIFAQRHLVELIRIIDRYAMIQSGLHDTYNYLSFAALLAGIGEETWLQTDYEARRRLLVALDRFTAGDDSLADSTVRSLEQTDMGHCTRMLFREVYALSCIGKGERNSSLWESMQAASDPGFRDLCRTVLAYNLSDETVQENGARKHLTEKISSLMGIDINLSSAAVIGYESGSLEFKTSIVFPPVKGGVKRVALAEQTHEILRQICGFLNAEGGTLMLGVNDFGVVIGLEGDLAYREFEGSRDRYCRYIRDSIRKEMGSMAESLVTETILDMSGHFVLALRVRPSEQPVLLRDILWQRRGAETLGREGAVKTSFFQTRSRVYALLDDTRKYGTDWKQDTVTSAVVS